MSCMSNGGKQMEYEQASSTVTSSFLENSILFWKSFKLFWIQYPYLDGMRTITQNQDMIALV